MELLRGFIKNQTSQNKVFKSTQKTLNEEYSQLFEKLSKSKDEHIYQNKEYDVVALETEISVLNQKVEYEKKILAREK